MDKMIKLTFNSDIKGIDDNEKTLTATVSTGATDRMNESLDPVGADLRRFKENPVVLFGHRYDTPPIAKALWVKKTKDGIISKMKFANTPFAQEIFELYKGGFMRAFSVGFLPKEAIDGDGIKQPRTTFTKWELLEYSAVPVPANPEALTMAMQKGILKNASLKKAFEQTPVDMEHEETYVEEVKSDIPEIAEIQPIDTGLNEVFAEVKELQRQAEILEVENAELIAEGKELRTKVYDLMNPLRKDNLSGITAADLKLIIVEEVGRVIRKIKGEVE